MSLQQVTKINFESQSILYLVNFVADDSFVVINSPVEEAMEVSSPGPAMRPGDGYTWSRQVGG